MSLAQERSIDVAEISDAPAVRDAPTLGAAAAAGEVPTVAPVGVMGTARAAGAAETVARYARQLWPAVREVLLVAALFMVYKMGRLLIDGHVAKAMANAWHVWDLERTLRLPSEVATQKLIVDHLPVVRAANYYYAFVHFPATAVCLIWMYLFRPTHYRWIRNVLTWVTAAALALHMLMPLAPPRMLTRLGIIDTAQAIGPAVYGSPNTDTLSNQYAAMPSLHVGWAVAVAVVLIAATRNRWRWLWLLHPVVTLAVVVVTGNHYWLDAVVAVALLMLAFAIVPRPRPRPRPRAAAPSPGAPAQRSNSTRSEPSTALE